MAPSEKILQKDLQHMGRMLYFNGAQLEGSHKRYRILLEKRLEESDLLLMRFSLVKISLLKRRFQLLSRQRY